VRFIEDSSSGINVIRAYGGGAIKVNQEIYRGPLIVSASAVVPGPAIGGVLELAPLHADLLLALDPELVLLGTGASQSFPAADFGARFLMKSIGIEVMDTGAACRTFNVLIAERRRVAALLFP
jgi:uncharacterized protein